ncbi:ABC transporter permease [Thermofilum pendens]|uniref:ABC-2 type transporter n=1 Tax=Thermofilum pendens (strain DSM 2475 / Hrk 5) TaxID=368408 RepID=A1S016_THEPD|nr:ABC transporter permease [Thermofilum pendens]ABL78796.1 ABC-2 type transporter [Thermofilum pendens Hrk 5]
MKKTRHAFFAVASGVLVKEAKIMTRYVGSLLMVVFMPFALGGLYIGVGLALAGPGALGNFQGNTGVSNPVLYFTLGGVLMVSSMIMIENTSSIIREEQLMGTFELHYLTPNSTVALWMLHALASSLLSVLIFALDVSIVALSGFRGVSAADWLLAFLVVLVGLLPLAGLGLVVAALTVRFKEVYAVSQTINAFVAMLSGFYYPLEVFPRVVRVAAALLPTSHASEILRELFGGTGQEVPIHFRIAAMFLLAVLYLYAGRTVYNRWEEGARRNGELSKY